MILPSIMRPRLNFFKQLLLEADMTRNMLPESEKRKARRMIPCRKCCRSRVVGFLDGIYQLLRLFLLRSPGFLVTKRHVNFCGGRHDRELARWKGIFTISAGNAVEVGPLLRIDVNCSKGTDYLRLWLNMLAVM